MLFICTANLLDTVPPALRDRMEVINLSGYTNEEKLEIAKRFLIPRQLQGAGISSDLLDISTDAVLRIIEQYTREAGLRNLERELAAICRKVARRVADGRTAPHPHHPKEPAPVPGSPQVLDRNPGTRTRSESPRVWRGPAPAARYCTSRPRCPRGAAT